MTRSIHAEWLKFRRSPVWLAFVLLPLLPAFMGTFNYLQNTGVLQDGWYSLWSQQTLFMCYFFLPAILGVYCSYLCRLEHLNHNWNHVLTMPVSVFHVYLSKLVSASVMVLLTQAWIGFLFVVSGIFAGLPFPLPGELPVWLVCGALGGIVICAVQLLLSLLIRSFAVPVAFALIGGIAGLFVFIKGYGVAFPYSLIDIGMRANQPGGPMQCGMDQFVISSAVYVAVCAFAAIWLIKKRDMAAG